MLFFKNGRFYAPGVSFALPDGFYLDTNPDTPHEFGITAWLESRDIWVDIYLDDESDPLSDLHNLFAEEDSCFIPYSPVEEIDLNGMKGFHASYHDSSNDYYECRLIVSADTAVTFFARGCKGTVADWKDQPEIQEFIKNIRKERARVESHSLEFQEKLCQMLRSLRIAAGLSQSELADKLGLSLSQYAYYEIGKLLPDLLTVKKLAEALGVDVSIFFNPEQYTTSPDCG